MDMWHGIGVALTFALAGGAKGVTGMGLPTVAMSLLGLWMPPWQAAALLILPSLVTNLAQCRGAHWRGLARRLWPGWLALALVTVFTPGFGSAASADAARACLGAILIAYGALGVWRPVWPDLSAGGAWLGALAGAASGVVTAVTAVFVLPWVPYLQSLRLPKDQMVQALGLSFTVATLALAVRVRASVSLDGWLGPDALSLGLALAGALAGMKAGEAWRARLAGPAFQRALCWMFIALGAVNLARSA